MEVDVAESILSLPDTTTTPSETPSPSLWARFKDQTGLSTLLPEWKLMFAKKDLVNDIIAGTLPSYFTSVNFAAIFSLSPPSFFLLAQSISCNVFVIFSNIITPPLFFLPSLAALFFLSPFFFHSSYLEDFFFFFLV